MILAMQISQRRSDAFEIRLYNGHQQFSPPKGRARVPKMHKSLVSKSVFTNLSSR
jgi:hypothetical protein